jgi:ribosome-binding factor A
MRSAVVYVTVMGEPAEQEQAMKGLQSARGYLQSLVADRLQTRFTPILSFKRDEGVKRSVEMSKLIDETLEADRRNRGIGGEGAPDEESRVDDSEDDPSDEDFDDEEDLDEPDEDSELEDDLADDDPSVPAPRTGLESRDPRPDDED